MQVKELAKLSPEDQVVLSEEEVVSLLKWHGIGVDSAHEQEFLESLRKYSLTNLSKTVLGASEAWGPKLISKLVTLGLTSGENPLVGLDRIVAPVRASETFVVVGIAFHYHRASYAQRREKGSTGNAKWNVRAFQSSESAEAFAQQLNDWCEANAVDASKAGRARRDAVREKRAEERESFYHTWWREHVHPTKVYELSYQDKDFARNQGDMVEAYQAFMAQNPVPELGHPPEDPQFLTSYRGTTYIVEALPTYA